MLLIIETITWKPHVETAMEIALRRRETGEEVVYCNLRRGLPACEDASPLHLAIDLPEIRVRRASEILEQHGVRCIRRDYPASALASATTRATAMLDACRDEPDLKALRYAGYHDIGWGVISSAVSITRDSTVSLASHRAMLRRYCEAAMLVYDQVCSLIDELKPDEILFFNGRFATTRAVLRAAQARGVPWKIHERGGDRDRYWLADYMPHDTDRIQHEMLAQWNEAQAEAAHGFFADRRQRIERQWHSFARDQTVGRLPAELHAPGEWVSFFTSSEDEMFAIADHYQNDSFPTQFDAIRAVAEAVDSIDGLRLCIRVHPHTGQKSRSDRAKWAGLDIPGAVVLGPDDSTDSYALVDRSRVVCTYGSTVGIEATYWRRPSLLLAPACYDRLDVAHRAGDVDEIRAFLLDPKVFPREHSLPYGAFWALLGEPYRFYQAESLHRGKICGVYLDDTRAMRAARVLLQTAARLIGGGR